MNTSCQHFVNCIAAFGAGCHPGFTHDCLSSCGRTITRNPQRQLTSDRALAVILKKKNCLTSKIYVYLTWLRFKRFLYILIYVSLIFVSVTFLVSIMITRSESAETVPKNDAKVSSLITDIDIFTIIFIIKKNLIL
jgi:hypothetical protein